MITFGDPVGSVRRCLDLMKLPPGAALSVVSSKPAERVVRRSYPDTEVICDKKEEDVFERIAIWVQQTSLRQVRLEHLVLYVQSPKLDHHIAVEMVVEALRRASWRLKIYLVWETLEEFQFPDDFVMEQGQSPPPLEPAFLAPWQLWDASEISHLRRPRHIISSRGWTAPWSWSEVPWEPREAPAWPDYEEEALDTAVFERHWMEDDDIWDLPPGGKLGPLRPCKD